MNVLYETAKSLMDERNFCRDIIQKHWPDHNAQKLAMRFGLDYAITKGGKVSAFIELKCRNILSSKYENVILNVNKLQSARQLTTNHVKCWLFVRWVDCDGMLEFGRHFMDYPLTMIERQDRDDPQDVSPCYEIPVKDFKVWKTRTSCQAYLSQPYMQPPASVS